MNALTEFGDAAVVLPLSAVMLVWLLWLRAHRAAVSWVVAVSLCIVGTALLKILLYICSPIPDLVSPSGHSSLSVLIYGALVLAIAAERRGWQRATVLSAGAGLIVGIAGSRFVLNVHSALEVGIGVLIGALTLALFASRYLRLRSAQESLRPLILPAIAVITLLHGHELHAEGFLHAISHYLNLGGNACGGREPRFSAHGRFTLPASPQIPSSMAGYDRSIDL
jgi:membrane-associated phospholipid phosphatase